MSRPDNEPIATPVPFAGCLKPLDVEARAGELILVGLPQDRKSTYRRGPAHAPATIRAAYDGACFNSTTEGGVDLGERVQDGGDWSDTGWGESHLEYRERAGALFRAKAVPFFLGGDHAVTIPLGQALQQVGEPVHVIQLDAHPDLYPDFDGDKHSHACTGARLLEMPWVASLTQIGVRCFNEVQRRVAREHKDRFRCFEAYELPGALPDLGLEGKPVYVTLDLDVFDPTFAPGVSHPVPGGLAIRPVLDLLRTANWRWIGMDVVELNPPQDQGHRTAILAGRLAHEAMGSVWGQQHPA